MRWFERVVAPAAVFGLLAGACVQADEAGINVQDFKAELVFGIDKEEPVAPTPFTPPEAPQFVQPPNIEFGNEIVVKPLPPIAPPSAVEEEDPCPDPRSTVTPELIADVNVTNLPTEGLYAWRGSLTGVTTEEGDLRDIDLGFMTRVLRRVVEVNDTTFEFETVQPNLAGGALEGTFTLTKYRVRTVSESVTPPNEAGPGLGALNDNGAPTPRLGEPDGGVSLLSTTIVDSSGDAVAGFSSFEPSRPLLLLPLPISSGQTFRSTAVDPRSGQTVAINGQMLDRRRINACGEPVDGWLVRIDQTTSSATGSATNNLDLVIAPQYGAIPIDEFTQFPDGSALNYTLSVLTPDELPEALA